MSTKEAVVEFGRLLAAWIRGEGPLRGLLRAYWSLLTDDQGYAY